MRENAVCKKQSFLSSFSLLLHFIDSCKISLPFSLVICLMSMNRKTRKIFPFPHGTLAESFHVLHSRCSISSPSTFISINSWSKDHLYFSSLFSVLSFLIPG